MNDQNADYWENRAVSYHELKEYEESIKDYSKAIQLNGQNDSYWIHRGNSYYESKIYE